MNAPSSHPWLVFNVIFESLPITIWGNIGQIIAMNRQIEAMPLTKSGWRRFNRLQLSRGAFSSAAIEGNPNSEEDALAIAKGQRSSEEYPDKEIHNLLDLYDRASEGTFLGHKSPSIGCLCQTNEKVLEQAMLPGKEAVPGAIRERGVHVGGYLGPDHSICRELLGRFERFFRQDSAFWLYHERAHSKEEIAIIKAIVAHLYVAWIHPFDDGNGRTARLIEFMILCNAKLSTAVGASLCRHYQQTRPKYYEELRKTSTPKTNWAQAPIGFIAYAVTGLRQSLQESVDEMLRGQRKKHWYKLLEESFPGQTKHAIRLRGLADLIATMDRNVSIANIRSQLSEGHAYRKLSYQTLSRDLHTLVKDGSVERVAWGKYRSCMQELTSSKGERFSSSLTD